jgi:hypothetical protein
MSFTPILYPQDPPNELNEFELSKTPTMIYSPVIHPEDSFGIPSPLNLSERNTFSLTDKNGIDYPLSDDETSKPIKLNFKYVESIHRKLSNENLKSNNNKEKEEKFFHNGKKYDKDYSDDDEFVLEANELDSDNEEEKICPQNDADNEDDDEENLGILRILKHQKEKI